MRTIIAWAVVAALALPAVAAAHVTIRPQESRQSSEEKYTVRVPTEGQVATVSIELDVPAGVTIVDVPAPEGATHEVKKTGERITMIKWTKTIPPKQSAEFVFVARNPAEEQIAWNARQNFADGTSRSWTPVTKLLTIPATSAVPSPSLRSPTRPSRARGVARTR